MEEHQYINQEMIFLIFHEVSSTHSHEWAKGAQSDNLWRPHPAMSNFSTCYHRQVLGSMWSCNRIPENGLANRIITKAQEVSLTEVMNENYIGQVYFSHPHIDRGIKQWILHTCAAKVVEADFLREWQFLLNSSVPCHSASIMEFFQVNYSTMEVLSPC